MKKYFIMLIIMIFGVFTYAVNISVSIYPYYLVINEIKAENDSLNLLIPEGKSPHTYSLTINDMKKLYASDAIFVNGLGAEVFIEKVFNNLEKRGIKISELGEFIPEDELIGDEDDDSEKDSADHHHGNFNPHVWISPYFMYEYIIPEIYSVLSEVNPSDKDVYYANSQKLIKKLKELDSDFFMKSKNKNISFLAFHDSFAYFAGRYGFVSAGVVQVSPGIDPTPSQMKNIMDNAKNNNVNIIFTEPQLSDRAARAIAGNMNIKTGILDPLGNEKMGSIIDLYEYNFYNFINE